MSVLAPARAAPTMPSYRLEAAIVIGGSLTNLSDWTGGHERPIDDGAASRFGYPAPAPTRPLPPT